MELNFNDNPTCMSGGAEGADLQWGMTAGKAGHQVIHWSFTGHRTFAPASEVVVLNEEQLDQANELIKLAAPKLKKHPPVKFPTKQLIQRNYFQIAWSDSVYAVSSIVDGIVQGGTSWAVAMYLARTDVDHQCYVFDQTTEAWYVKNTKADTWDRIDWPPAPKGVWAGIGTRNLTNRGKNAIRTLMEYDPPWVI